MFDKRDIPNLLQAHRSGPVAVLGGGVSGRAVAALLAALEIPAQIFDRSGVGGASADFGSDAARRHRLVIFSPAFGPEHPWRLCAADAGCELLSEVDFGSLFWPGSVVAVTGTNGKTTLVDFLTFALKRSGTDAIAAGNIGYPVSRLAETNPGPDSLAVLEISSFQAESLHCLQPQAVLWTHFAEDHLDRHGSLENYFRAKWKLVECLPAGGLFCCVADVMALAAKFGLETPTGVRSVVVDTTADGPDRQCWMAALPQCNNYQVAAAYWRECGHDPRILLEAAREFKPPPHRLGKTGEVGEVEFWNDSKATNFSAALAALKQFTKPVYWIGGGLSKGGDLQAFADAVAGHVQEAFLIGQTAEPLSGMLQSRGIRATVCRDLDEAVTSAHGRIDQPAVVLLSPGFASMDQFRDYNDRGISFERAVFSLKQRALAASPESCTPLSKELL